MGDKNGLAQPCARLTGELQDDAPGYSRVSRIT
jgi:hypothetical protein